MPPKGAPPPAVEAVPEIPEETEEGEGRVAFRLAVAGVSGLPCPLETSVLFGGICRQNRSSPSDASENPFDFELPKDKFIRVLQQDLYDDIVSTSLEVTLCDAAAENAEIGRAQLSLLPLLHDRTLLEAELELSLTEDYYIKWWPEKEAEAAEANSKDKKAAGKAKAKAKAGTEDELPKELVKRPEGFVPPRTVLRLSISVDELVAPAEDRDDWTTFTCKVAGVYGLPERMTSLGLAAPTDDVELHQLTYRALLFGSELGVGTLAKAKEEPPAEGTDAGAEGTEAEATPALSADERRERFAPSVQLKDPVVRYRGARFLRDLRAVLNESGGTWVYFLPEEKPSTDPKKANPPEVAALAKHFAGKAWLDLRSFLRPGMRQTEVRCALRTMAEGPELLAEEPLLQASDAFVRLSLELRAAAVSPPEPPVEDLRALAPPRRRLGKFPSSAEAATMYREAVEQSLAAILGHGGGAENAAAAVEQLKAAGVYDDLRESLRGAVIRVFRERIRKDPGTVPGKPLQGAARDELLSGTYTYLKETAAALLDEPRRQGAGGAGGFAEPAAAGDAGGLADAAADGRCEASPRGPFLSDAATRMVAVAAAESAGLMEESPGEQRAREVLAATADVAGRSARLAFEAEHAGNWGRAADLLQNRLLLDEVRCRPQEWIAYAKLCARARGRQSAAEEALRQAVILIAGGAAPDSPEDARDVDMMLACLLLDRGRTHEALRVFREWHEKDPSEPMFLFFLGLATFLADEDPAEASRLLKAVGGGGANVEPYVVCLEKLLDFGLPSLAFTFLDQCKVVPEEALQQEPLALLDARASVADRDFSAGLSRVERLTASANASQEAWRLQGECHFHLGDMDRALQSLNQAMSFERKFEEPAVYIRLGTVLVAKKRWKQAREAYLKSIQLLPTAEAWSGAAYAEYRSDELQMCYEALCEANLLDNERADVWALLTLVHLRLENWTQASHCFKQCLRLKADCEDLLVEVAAEFVRSPPETGGRQPDLAAAAARRAMELRDSGQARSALSEALAAQGLVEQAAAEAQEAMRRLVGQPEPRKAIFDKSLRFCDDAGRHDLVQKLHELQLQCDQKARGS